MGDRIGNKKKIVGAEAQGLRQLIIMRDRDQKTLLTLKTETKGTDKQRNRDLRISLT